MSDFEAVIGLEVHVQLATDSKIFCSCPARLPAGESVADVQPNLHTCPVCTAQPGALPVLNKKAVEYAVRVGLATHCKINDSSVFARKNYFYPDLPKGYQISQYDRPLCEEGFINVTMGEATDPTAQATKKVRIQRIHMEEDAGKNVHSEAYSLVNLNRAGVPLVEVVSAPDIASAEEAGAYLRALYAIVTYLGVCDGNLQEGNFRCDANVSIRPKGSDVLGTRVEIKNVNSFRFVEKAIEYEISRQAQVIESGGKVVQETRTFDSDRGVTSSMRSKEEAHDYRYFPDPDLIEVPADAAWVEQIRSQLPELPEQRRARYVAEWGLSAYDAGVITASKSLAEFFEAAVQLGDAELAKPVANLLTGEVARMLNDEGIDISRSRLKPAHLADLARLTREGVVSSTGAKKALSVCWKAGQDAPSVVEEQGLKQVSDLTALEPAIDEVLAASANQVAQYKAGKDKLMGYFVGQVMRRTGGKANPSLLQEMIRKKLENS